MTIEAYPLYWPFGRPRTEPYRRQKAQFVTTFAKARDDVVRQIRLLGQVAPGSMIVSTNVTLRRDGLPLAGQRQPDDPGVAVYFTRKKTPMCFACDRWNKVEHNMQAIAKTIDALRGVARWGTGDMMQAAFTGFIALPAPVSGEWWRVLDVPQDSTAETIKAAYRRLAAEHHPDKGGDPARMAEINDAYRRATA